MLDVVSMLDRAESLAKERGLSKARFSEEVGISNSALAEWRKGKSRPTLASTVKMAEYLGISLDYLVYGTEPGAAAQDGASSSVMQRYNRLPPECQQKVLYYMDGMLAVTEMQGSAQKAS